MLLLPTLWGQQWTMSNDAQSKYCKLYLCEQAKPLRLMSFNNAIDWLHSEKMTGECVEWNSSKMVFSKWGETCMVCTLELVWLITCSLLKTWHWVSVTCANQTRTDVACGSRFAISVRIGRCQQADVQEHKSYWCCCCFVSEIRCLQSIATSSN